MTSPRARTGRISRAFAASFVAIFAACDGREHVVGRGDGSVATPRSTSCPQFEPGTNMLGASWSDDEGFNGRAGKVAQSAGDADVSSTLVVSELFDACQDLALALPGDTSSLGAPSVPPSGDDARDACALALAGVDFLRTQTPATPLVQAISKPCDERAAKEACLAGCADEDSCAEYCATAITWLSECQDAAVTITFDPDIAEDLLPAWHAVELATSRVLASRARLVLANRALVALATATSDTFYLKNECFDPIFGAATTATQRNEVAAAVIDEFLRSIAVLEG